MRQVARLVGLVLGALACAIPATTPAQAIVPTALIVPGQGGLFSYDALASSTILTANARSDAAPARPSSSSAPWSSMSQNVRVLA